MGLCLRNGYGMVQNTDSARFWLAKSAAMGYKQSQDELSFKEPENNYDAGNLLQNIKIMQVRNAPPVNRYTKVTNLLQPENITGNYTGYLIKYDWSGQYIISSNPLQLQLTYDNDLLTGKWIEDDSIELKVNAELTKKAVLFKGMSYNRNDHYHPVNPINYFFEEAVLQTETSGDTVYLSGNIKQFKPKQNEPGKPIKIVLMRTGNNNSAAMSNSFFNIQNSKLLVYPNPFNNGFTVDFVLKESAKVFTQIFTTDGKLIYTTGTETLQPGTYTLPVQVNIPAGTYFVKLSCGKKNQTATVIKQ